MHTHVKPRRELLFQKSICPLTPSTRSREKLMASSGKWIVRKQVLAQRRGRGAPDLQVFFTCQEIVLSAFFFSRKSAAITACLLLGAPLPRLLPPPLLHCFSPLFPFFYSSCFCFPGLHFSYSSRGLHSKGMVRLTRFGKFACAVHTWSVFFPLLPMKKNVSSTAVKFLSEELAQRSPVRAVPCLCLAQESTHGLPQTEWQLES